MSTSQTLRDGRTVRLVGLGERTAPLLHRISAQLDDAVDAVSAFWGPDWPREIVVVAAGTDAQFAAVGGGDSHTAATTTGERIMFAPGAAQMNDDSLRIVLRHELFHYAARAETAADAPRWLTEGVADYVGRPPTPLLANSATMAQRGFPTDEELKGQRNAHWPTTAPGGSAGSWPALTAPRPCGRCTSGRAATATLTWRPRCGTPSGTDVAVLLAEWRQWLSG